MKQLSNSGQQAVNDIAQRHGFSPEAVASMLESVINGNGSMAQFNHFEFSGSGQWMRGGMTMVSDMFNGQLKGRVDSLCAELSRLLANQPGLLQLGGFQSQNQGGQQQTSHSGGGSNQDAHAPMNPSASLFVAPAPGTSPDWWPADLRWPNSTGAQNGVRYAYFAQARRLAIELNGSVTVYDTQDHQIGGFSQQQSYGGSVTFSSQYGLVDVTRLPVISINGVQQNLNVAGNTNGFAPIQAAIPEFLPEHLPAASGPQAPFALQPESQSRTGNAVAVDADIFLMIEKLADLRSRAIISDEDFNAKKTELLARL
ncbi:SHOCT domain-containing protein [Polaromonas sp. DSR2-3-2]|uniref:SHOCT domain-containing protein n=1 Tax=unclassified Polaromonas TaxID=2638319 RepID=UPI003CE7A12E